MHSDDRRRVLITGGAGFIGTNLAARLLTTTEAHVRIFDNLSRLGVRTNAEWLQTLARKRSGRDGKRLELVVGDVRDAEAVARSMAGRTEVYHLAAQVAVTTSVAHPATDFEVNARGTLNVLEAARQQPVPPTLLFTSTNKVYGGLESVATRSEATRYTAVDGAFHGVDEAMPLDFHSPYGCSKGAADQYVRDYGRIYGMPTIVFRMSCICGPHQFGTEDQGWVAHFLYSLLRGEPVTIYGDGRQVRDILHVDDLLDAMHAACAHLPVTRGQVYNVGGGPERAVSVLEMLTQMEAQTGRSFARRYSEVRPGDQPLYISNMDKLARDAGWRPRRSVRETLDAIYSFWKSHQAAVGSEPVHAGAGSRERLPAVRRGATALATEEQLA